MEVYRYSGPVEMFGKCVDPNWEGGTRAVSESRARCNLAYQWKKKNGYDPSAKITLPGKIYIL